MRHEDRLRSVTAEEEEEDRPACVMHGTEVSSVREKGMRVSTLGGRMDGTAARLTPESRVKRGAFLVRRLRYTLEG